MRPARSGRCLAGRLAVLGAAAVWLCRLGPSDRWVPTGLLAYVPPAATLVAAAAGFAMAAPGLSPWRAAALLLGAASLAQVVADNPRLLAPSPPDAGGVVVLHWNVGRNPRVAGVLPALAEGADVVALSESDRVARGVLGEGWEEWERDGLRIAARSRIEAPRLVRLRWARALHAVIRTDPPLSLVLADVNSVPWAPRWSVLGALATEIRHLDPPPDLIVGDLNTPSHAASLGRLFAMGYAPPPPAVSAGPWYTWPTPLPVMRLDHVLAAAGTTITRHVSGAWWRSDHRWQRVAVRPSPAGPATAGAAGPRRGTLSP